MTLSRTITAGLLLLLVGLPARAEDKPKDPPKPEASYEIPYKLTDTKHVMVRVKLNGKGPFNFILDTGAPALIVTEAVAKKVGAKIEKGWGKFKLEVEGGLTVPDAKGIAMDMFQLKGMNSMGVAGVEHHGVLGYNNLAKIRIQYDFTQDKLAWTVLKIEPPEIKRLGDEGGDTGQGGMEMMANLMKFIAPLMGLKPNFELRPRGFLGILGKNDKDGVQVEDVVKESPADKAGLKTGDLITSLQDKSIADFEKLIEALAKAGEGDKIKVKILRDKEEKELTIELGKGL